jgi:hypothetical protein
MFDDLLPSPACLFRFKIDLHRLKVIDQVSDFQSWGLEDKHQLPPIGLKKEPGGSITTKIGWNPQGLFFEFHLGSLRQKLDRIYPAFYIQLSINSRFNSSILRENEFCSTFNFTRVRAGRAALPSIEVIPLERLHASVTSQSNRRPEEVGTASDTVMGWVRASSTNVTLWHHIATGLMHGFRPEEFPDIGIDFQVGMADLDRTIEANCWSMCYESNSGVRTNPSLWTHCHLV